MRAGQDESPGIGRHVQTIVVGLTLAAMAWTASTLLDLKATTARMEEQISSLRGAIVDANGDRFKGADWTREKARLDELHQVLERRVERIEQRLNGGGR